MWKYSHSIRKCITSLQNMEMYNECVLTCSASCPQLKGSAVSFEDPLLSQSMNLDVCVWCLQRCKHGPSLANQSQSWCFSRAIRGGRCSLLRFCPSIATEACCYSVYLSFWGESQPCKANAKDNRAEIWGGRKRKRKAGHTLMLWTHCGWRIFQKHETKVSFYLRMFELGFHYLSLQENCLI